MNVNMSMSHDRRWDGAAKWKWDLSATNIPHRNVQNGTDNTNGERGDGLLTDCQWIPASE